MFTASSNRCNCMLWQVLFICRNLSRLYKRKKSFGFFLLCTRSLGLKETYVFFNCFCGDFHFACTITRSQNICKSDRLAHNRDSQEAKECRGRLAKYHSDVTGVLITAAQLVSMPRRHDCRRQVDGTFSFKELNVCFRKTWHLCEMPEMVTNCVMWEI